MSWVIRFPLLLALQWPRLSLALVVIVMRVFPSRDVCLEGRRWKLNSGAMRRQIELQTRYIHPDQCTVARWLRLRLIVTPVIFLVAITVAAVWVNYRWSTSIPDDASSSSVRLKNMTTLSATPPDQTGAEDYAVYSAALSDPRYIDSSVKLLVIRDRTFRYPSSQQKKSKIPDLIERVPELERDTLNDYQARNKDEQQLSSLFNLKVKSELIDGRNIDELLEKNFIEGWQAIKAKYPDSNGVITLSRVGFNRQKTQALVYIAISCGPHCGEGNFMLLSKTRDGWSIRSKLMM